MLFDADGNPIERPWPHRFGRMDVPDDVRVTQLSADMWEPGEPVGGWINDRGGGEGEAP